MNQILIITGKVVLWAVGIVIFTCAFLLVTDDEGVNIHRRY